MNGHQETMQITTNAMIMGIGALEEAVCLSVTVKLLAGHDRMAINMGLSHSMLLSVRIVYRHTARNVNKPVTVVHE